MWIDPIVEEVRKHRREIEKECKNDFSVLFIRAREIEKTLRDRLVSKIPGKRKSSKVKVSQ
jgi:hypothetical protein